MDIDEITISSYFFNNEKCSDIKIILKDEIFHAHGTILLLRCPKLFDEARGTTIGTSYIVMDSYPIGPIKEILSLIYTGKCNVNEENCEEILKLAVRFEPPNADLCKNIECLLKESELPILLKYMQVALDNHVDSLLEIGMHIIGKTFSDILKSNELQNISNELFVKILTMCNLVCDNFSSEMEVFEAVLKYIESHCGDENLKVELIPLVRYTTLNCEEFSECFKKLPGLRDFIKTPELVFMKIAGVESDEVGKCSGFDQTNRLNEEVVHDKQDTFKFDLDSYERHKGFIPRNVTVMEISKSIVVTEIGLYCVVDKDINANIKIRNRHGTVLTTGAKILEGNNGESKVGINLSPLIKFNPNKQYFIHIEYNEKIRVSHFRNENVESSITNTMEDVDMKLDNFNRMIAQIVAFKI